MRRSKPSALDIERRRESRRSSRQRRRRAARHEQEMSGTPWLLGIGLEDVPPPPPPPQEDLIRKRIKMIRRLNRRLIAGQRRRTLQRIEDELLPQNAEWECIICMEGPNFQDEERNLGRLLNPCECRGSLARYHYRCLCDFMMANAARPCARCGYQFKDPRIRRFNMEYLNLGYRRVDRMILFRDYEAPGHPLYFNVTQAQIQVFGGRPAAIILADRLAYNPIVERFWNYYVPIVYQMPTDQEEQYYIHQDWFSQGVLPPPGLVPLILYIQNLEDVAHAKHQQQQLLEGQQVEQQEGLEPEE